MAKALFHKSQRVFVKPVGIWTFVERVVPHWVKDVDEPLRISYDCGLGRLFQAHELLSERAMQAQGRSDDEDDDDLMLEHWRIERRMLKWRSAGHGLEAHPGTLPVVATDEGSSGGWRVPASEYERDPQRIEHQALIIMHAPDLLQIARKIAEFASENPSEFPAELAPVARRCASILRIVYQLNDDDAASAAE